MKISYAAALALACTALAASTTTPTEFMSNNVMLDGLEGSLTNSRQVFDTLNHQLKSHDGHATADVLVAFITGADSQIDNAIATVSNALAPFTFGLSKAIGNVLLGPVVQSITNGAEVMLANLIAAPFDGASDLVMNSVQQYQKQLSRMSSMASKHNVETTRLNGTITKLNEVLAKHHKAGNSQHKRENHMLDGVEGSLTNSRQVMDTLNHELKSHDGHAAADVLVAFITGADSQIDNAIATVSNALAPLTLGLSKAVGNVLLGPVVQSITNGAEVLLANLIAAPIDGISDTVVNSVKNYQKSISRMSTLTAKHNVDVGSKLGDVNDRLVKFVDDVEHRARHRKGHVPGTFGY